MFQSKIKYLFIIFLLTGVCKVFAVNANETSDPVKEKFNLLMSNPSQFKEIEQGEIYMNYIKQSMSKNIDTAYILFDEMIAFGHLVKSDLLIALGNNNKASTYLAQRDSDKSIPYLREALSYSRSYPDTYMNVLYNLSQYYRTKGMLDSSMVMIDAAAELNNTYKISKKQQASFYLSRAEVLSDLNKFHSAIEAYQDALSVQDKNDNPLKFGNTLFRISELYVIINDYEMAQKYLKEALQISEQNKYQSSLASQLLQAARQEMHFNNYNKADSLLSKSIAISLSRNDSFRLNRSYSTLGILNIKRNMLSDARRNVTEAEKYRTGVKDEGDKIPLLTLKGELAIEEKKYPEAKVIYLQIIDIAKKVKQSNVSIDAYQKLRMIAQLTGDFKEAVLFGDSLLHYIDKKDISNQTNILYDLETKYQKKQQDQEISYLNTIKIAQDKALAVRNNTIILGSVMLVILSVLLFGLYRLYKKNQESQTKLTLQNVKITETLAQNQLLIKEIHHRVKNNLQVISSLLNLQERKIEDGAAREALKASQARVNTMSLIHKSLYQKDDVRYVDVKQYFSNLTENLVSSFALNDVELTMDIEALNIDVDSLVPLGLVANELICNALKHGIRGKQDGKLSVMLHQDTENVILTVEDNGGELKSDELLAKDGSLGTRLIKAFTSNLEGELKVEGGDVTKISLIVPKKQLLFVK